MLSLYDLTGMFADLRDFVDNEDPTPEQQDKADAMMAELLEDLIPEKVAGYCGLIRSLKLEADAYKAEEQRLKERRASNEALAERLQNRLQNCLAAAGVRKLKAGTFSVAIQASPASVEVVDEGAIPDAWKIPQPSKVDKRALLAELKTGAEVPGVRLKQGEHLRIR